MWSSRGKGLYLQSFDIIMFYLLAPNSPPNPSFFKYLGFLIKMKMRMSRLGKFYVLSECDKCLWIEKRRRGQTLNTQNTISIDGLMWRLTQFSALIVHRITFILEFTRLKKKSFWNRQTKLLCVGGIGMLVLRGGWEARTRKRKKR